MLRLTGLYLALSTLAFGLLMDKLVFQASFAFGFNGTLDRRAALDRSASTSTPPGRYVVLMTAFFVLMGFALLALRAGVLGRVLIAMRDSPAACGTLGLDMRWFRVGLFALTAGMAGLAGGLFAGLRGTIGATDFQLLASLPLLLLAVVCGVTSVTGAALGGVALMLLPVLQSYQPGPRRPDVRGHRLRRRRARPRPQRPGQPVVRPWADGSDDGWRPRGRPWVDRTATLRPRPGRRTPQPRAEPDGPGGGAGPHVAAGG